MVMSIEAEFQRTLEMMGRRRGIDLDAAMVAEFMGPRIQWLSGIVDHPGYQEALQDAAGLVLLKAAGRMVDIADAADAELFGTIVGMLSIAARIAAGV